ncbi:MAG TPA: sigma-54 dependent transcriptional regulator [Gemmataceae bacterium]|nr:sigma-54 dependent transcriptional regulator [Gemmataceae bacterium]
MDPTNTHDNHTAESIRVLIIDDEKLYAETVAEGLQTVGYECVVATSGQAGAKKVETEEFGVILTDLKMAGVDGLAILRKAKQEQPDAKVVVITGHSDVKTAVEAMREGAASYLVKQGNLAEIRAWVDKAAELYRLNRTNRELKRQLDEKFGFEGVIGGSPKMHDVISKLRSIAPTSATVLIQGETGTGKELVARAIHHNSPRAKKNFVAMNCTALNENLLDDELFGHEAGAYTGAVGQRKGRFEHANGGTLFLDEVGDMPLALQAKLLRVLENQEVYRIGSNDAIKVNVRLISATNRDLQAAVDRGEFRRDLYHRLKVVTIKLPALRERREDLSLLCAYFIEDFNKKHGKKVSTRLAEPLRKAMDRYEWQGNVRELRNLIESMVVQDQDGVLGLDDLQESEGLGSVRVADGTIDGPAGLVGRPLVEIERYYIEKTLEMTNGNREEASRILGIGERTLYRDIQDWKMQDKIRDALNEAGGDIEAAAKRLGVKAEMLTRKIKKWGLQTSSK